MASRKIAFLDRDGVVNLRRDDPYYVTNTDQFVFNEGIFRVLTKLVEDGFEFIVVTNQRAIARGLLTEDALFHIHEHMKEKLRERGIEILDIFFCPHGHDECACGKPSPGMLHKATEKYDINLAESILISDSKKDVEMGEQFGIGKNIFVEENKPEQFFEF